MNRRHLLATVGFALAGGCVEGLGPGTASPTNTDETATTGTVAADDDIGLYVDNHRDRETVLSIRVDRTASNSTVYETEVMLSPFGDPGDNWSAEEVFDRGVDYRIVAETDDGVRETLETSWSTENRNPAGPNVEVYDQRIRMGIPDVD